PPLSRNSPRSGSWPIRLPSTPSSSPHADSPVSSMRVWPAVAASPRQSPPRLPATTVLASRMVPVLLIPPPPTPSLSLIVLLVTVNVPLVLTPPPTPQPEARLPLTVLLTTVTAPAVARPP